MARVKVTFHKCIQDSQDFGSDDEHMVSRVFFTVEAGGRVHRDVHADLKQTVGSDYATGPIEVGPPVGYAGPFSHAAFARTAEAYFRGLVGAGGSGIRIQGASNVRMQNNAFLRQQVVEFEASGREGGW